MEISSLPISASLRAKLISGGYTCLSSLFSVSHSQISRDLKISENETLDILRVASQRRGSERSNGTSSIVNGAQSAWEMLNEEESLGRITTSCSELDDILGGGIRCKEVTEIGGVPGIGKTQLGIQLAVNVQIPMDYGGLQGKAIYIDTEGSFMVERALQIAEACSDDMREYHGFLNRKLQSCQVHMQPKDFLENIFYFRVCSYTEQIAVVNYLEKFISEHKDVKVVIIDSITFHFRQDFDDMALRTRLLGGMALKLMKLAKKFTLAVILLNQVTTKFTEGQYQLTLALVWEKKDGDVVLGIPMDGTFDQGGPIRRLQKWASSREDRNSLRIYSYDLKSATDRFPLSVIHEVVTVFFGPTMASCIVNGTLGLNTFDIRDSWSHACTNRVILYWNGNERYAYIDKSPSVRSAAAPYCITGRGIRSSVSNCKRVKMM